MKKRLLIPILWVACLLMKYNALSNNTIDSVDIIQGTFKGLADCVHYKVIGMCFWFKCSMTGCGIRTSLKLDHYLPDTVVSVYTKPNNNPWWYAKTMADPVFHQAGKIQFQQFTHTHMGYGHEHDCSERDINNKFHEVDIIGNPALWLLSSVGFLLPSTATSYSPYYSSLFDAYAWRFPALERFYPGSQIPGLHDVGRFIIHDWGPVYPRNGYVNQPDDAKAAAVNALRAPQRLSLQKGSHISICRCLIPVVTIVMFILQKKIAKMPNIK